MLTGDIRNQVDQIWNAFWSGGVSNPLSVIEQITYLLFIKRLDELQTLEESKAEALGSPVERRIFPKGNDDKGRPYADKQPRHCPDHRWLAARAAFDGSGSVGRLEGQQ
jgi:type I restriction enzyme M protein